VNDRQLRNRRTGTANLPAFLQLSDLIEILIFAREGGCAPECAITSTGA
jgi:hypothetical protein